MIKISKISKAADALGVKLGEKRAGHPGSMLQSIENRNLLMLAVYEYDRDGTGTGNNYGGEITYSDLCNLFGLSINPIYKGLIKARAIKKEQPERFHKIKKLIKQCN